MRAIDEMRSENDPTQCLMKEGKGLRCSSDHVKALLDVKESCLLEKGNRKNESRIYPIRGTGDVLLDLRPHLVSSNLTQLREASQHTPTGVAHPLEEFPSGHYLAGDYGARYPKSHFALHNAQEELSMPHATSAGCTLLEYAKGTDSSAPLLTSSVELDAPIRGVVYLNPQTGELVYGGQEDPVLSAVALNPRQLGERASHRVLKRCCRKTIDTFSPSDEHLILKGPNSKVSEERIKRLVEGRLRLQALHEGRQYVYDEVTAAAAVESEDCRLDENPLTASKVKFSSEVDARSGSEEAGSATVPQEIGGGAVQEEVKGTTTCEAGEYSDEELNELLDWAEGLDPDSL